MNIEDLKKEAKSKKTAATRLEQLARHSDTSIQQAVTGNPSTPASALEYLGGHGKFNILKAVAKNPNTPDAVLEKLARHKQATVREAVANRDVLPASIALHFAKSDEKNLKRALLYRSHPRKVWEILAADADEDIREVVAREETISEALFEQLLNDTSPQVRQALGYNEKIQNRPDWIERLATDSEPLVRRAALVFGGHSLLERLVHDTSDIVRCGVAESEFISDDIANLLLKDPSEEVRAELAYSSFLEKTSLALSLALAADTDKVRWVLAGNMEAPLQALERLASDPHSHIRWRIAENESTPKAVLQKLLKDKDKHKFWYADEFGEAQDPEVKEHRTTIAQIAKSTLETIGEDNS